MTLVITLPPGQWYDQRTKEYFGDGGLTAAVWFWDYVHKYGSDWCDDFNNAFQFD